MFEAKKYKVLFILPALNVCGGMESFIMNYYRNMDRTKFQFDFLAHSVNDNSYLDEIKALGGKIYIMPSFSVKTVSKIKSQYIKILKENKYDIVHCNMANAAFIYLKYANKCDVPVRILHSHQNKAAGSLSHAIRNVPLIALGKKYANCNVACSALAGRFLFKNGDFKIIPNAIDYEKYRYNSKVREEVRTELRINDELLIGHTGRLSNEKNQTFLLNVFHEFVEKNPDTKLLLVGEGENEEQLKNQVVDLGLKDKVIFTGSRSDIDRLLQAMDMFVFPSIYEGLGISVLEAQASGLYCICSDGVPAEAKISEKFDRIALDAGMDSWVKKIEEVSHEVIDRENIKLSPKYDIKNCSGELEKLYIEEMESVNNGNKGISVRNDG